MKTKHTPGKWTAHKLESGSIVIKEEGLYESGYSDRIAELHEYPNDIEANAKLIAHAPELNQMVYDLMKCIKRLTEDELSQHERDTEAQWIGEAHELLNSINSQYYKNANA